MTTFSDIAHGYVAKFSIDENFKFRATVKRNSLLGYWAAQKLGLTGAAADAYAKEIVTDDLENPDPEGVFKEIRADFLQHGVVQSDHQIRRSMEEFMAAAIAEVRRTTEKLR
jgi:hypothetical protein